MNIREKLGLKPKATPQFGQSRSHAMNASKKMFKPNIQNKTVILRCIRLCSVAKHV